MNQKVCVIGEGAWGTAIASVLAHNGHEVAVWCQDPQVAIEINTKHENVRYMPGVVLNTLMHATDHIDHAMQDASLIFCSTPVVYLRSVLERARIAYKDEQIWVMLNKGIEQKTHMYATEILDDVFGTKVRSLFLCGPSFAREVMYKEITAIVLAATDVRRAEHVRAVLENQYLKACVSDDLVGTQICAALKNTAAIGAGIVVGAGYGENAKAFFLTRVLGEIKQLVVAMAGKGETVDGLAGVGDLILTACSSQGRNVAIGKRIGAGERIATLNVHTAVLPEGINTIISMASLAQRYKVAMPLHQALYHVVFDGEPASELVDTLMSMQ